MRNRPRINLNNPKKVVWGVPIPVANDQPKWLSAETPITVIWKTGSEFIHSTHKSGRETWTHFKNQGYIYAIRLHVDHFAYVALRKGYEPFGGRRVNPYPNRNVHVLHRNGVETRGESDTIRWDHTGTGLSDIIGVKRPPTFIVGDLVTPKKGVRMTGYHVTTNARYAVIEATSDNIICYIDDSGQRNCAPAKYFNHHSHVEEPTTSTSNQIVMAMVKETGCGLVKHQEYFISYNDPASDVIIVRDTDGELISAPRTDFVFIKKPDPAIKEVVAQRYKEADLRQKLQEQPAFKNKNQVFDFINSLGLVEPEPVPSLVDEYIAETGADLGPVTKPIVEEALAWMEKRNGK